MKRVFKPLLTVIMITAFVAIFMNGCSQNASVKTDVSSASTSTSSSVISDSSSAILSSALSLSNIISSSAINTSSKIPSSSKSSSSKVASSSRLSSSSSQPSSSSALKPAVTLILATTTSLNDSGLLSYLEPYLKSEENISLNILAQGSGQAIQTAKDGNCDVLIAHSPAAEQAFVDSGYGVDRQQFAYNYFVIVGPIADPAGVSNTPPSAAAAFTKIYNNYAKNKTGIFYSRDDKSGTDTKEKGIWASVGFDTTTFSSDFYKRTGTGMLATLTMADQTDGYTLTDKATYLANKSKLPDLKVLFEKNDELINKYSVTLINKDKYPNLKYNDAERFHDWLLKPSTQQLIANYGKAQYGEQLFYVS